LGNNSVIERQTRFVNWLNKKRASDSQIHVFPTLWQTDESYSDKRRRLSEYNKQHPDIQLVYGISAGASLAMSLVLELAPEISYHFVSGKLKNPSTVGSERRKRAPALYDSVVASEQAISAINPGQFDITCHVGYLDGVLAQDDMVLPQEKFDRIPMINHSATIAVAYWTILRKL